MSPLLIALLALALPLANDDVPELEPFDDAGFDWNALVSDGVQRGRLPTTRPTTDDLTRLGIRASSV